jgi:hypothetical protein
MGILAGLSRKYKNVHAPTSIWHIILDKRRQEKFMISTRALPNRCLSGLFQNEN